MVYVDFGLTSRWTYQLDLLYLRFSTLYGYHLRNPRLERTMDKRQ